MKQKDIEIRIEHEVEKRVRLRCAAFWTTLLGVAATVGSWAANNLRPIKEGIKAFLEAL